MSEAGFAAVVTKDHDYAGVTTAALIPNITPSCAPKSISGIVLNNVVGGINPYAVEHTAAMGGKTVWMPTLAAENHLRWERTAKWVHPASTQKMRAASPVPVLDANRKVLDAVKEVLDVIAKDDMVLASGHLHVSETWLVFEEAQRRGVKRLMFTHPEDIVDASMNDVQGSRPWEPSSNIPSACSWTGRSSRPVRRTTCAVTSTRPASIRRFFARTWARSAVFSPLEGFAAASISMRLGYRDADIHKMVSTNTARVLGLEGLVPLRRGERPCMS